MSEPSDVESVSSDTSRSSPCISAMKKIRGSAPGATGRAAFTYEVGRFLLLNLHINPEYHRLRIATAILSISYSMLFLRNNDGSLRES